MKKNFSQFVEWSKERGRERQMKPKNENDSIVCARCTKPIVGERVRVGRFTYCETCVLKDERLLKGTK